METVLNSSSIVMSSISSAIKVFLPQMVGFESDYIRRGKETSFVWSKSLFL